MCQVHSSLESELKTKYLDIVSVDFMKTFCHALVAKLLFLDASNQSP
jgi:hypothetical protein